MHSGLSLPTPSRDTRQHMMQPCGAPCRLVWAPPQRTRHAPLLTSPSSRPALADWGCRKPRTPARRLTGRAGPMPSLCSANGARPFRIGRSAASLTLVGQPAYGQPLKPAGCLWLKARPTCLPGGARPPQAIAEPGAVLAAIPPCALAFPGRSARCCLAPSYPKRPPHLAHR